MTKEKTKKGAASIYAVVFVTLLLGIVAVSFVRLILRGSSDTTNNELASSSRDSALAGVEDAKRAVDLYLQNTSLADPTKCDFVSTILYGTSDEVKISETSTGNSRTEQAYTCVIVDPSVEEYKGYLDNSSTVAIIPLKYNSPSGPDKIEFSWQLNNNNTSSITYPNQSYFENKDKQSASASELIAPVISLEYVQASQTLDPVADYEPYKPNSSVHILTPVSGASSPSLSFTRNDSPIDRTKVHCTTTNEYICSVTVSLPSDHTDKDKYLIVSLPYGIASTGSQTDFKVRMLKNDGTPVNFFGVQILVDSTGRANDLYTRLEVRLNNVDPNFPYPQFAVQTNGDLEKQFWVSKGCQKIDNGQVTDSHCPNSGFLDNSLHR